MLQQIIDGVDDGVGQVIILVLSWGSCRTGLIDVKWGHLSQAYNFGVVSPTPALTRLAMSLITTGSVLPSALDADG